MRLARGIFAHAVALLQAALLLGVQLTDGAGVHRCPEHDGPVGRLVVAAGAHEAHAAMGHEGHQGGAPEHHTGCICLGACHSANPALAPSREMQVAWSAAILGSPFIRSDTPRHTAPDHTLPYAVGPPPSA